MKNISFLLLILFLNVDCVIFNSDYKIENREKSESEKFHELLSEQWEKGIVRNPERASSLGDNRFNDKLNDTSYETIMKRQDETRELQETVKKIDRSKLSEDDQLNYDLYLHGIEKQIEGFQFLSYLIPIDQMGGIQIGFAGISNYMPFNTVKDYENYLARMRAFPAKLDQTIDLMKRGVKEGWVPPKIILVSVPDQIKAQFGKIIEESPLFKPFNDFPESIPIEEQARLIDEMVSALTEYVIQPMKHFILILLNPTCLHVGSLLLVRIFPMEVFITNIRSRVTQPQI